MFVRKDAAFWRAGTSDCRCRVWPAKLIFTESGLRFLWDLARQISWFCRSLFLSVYPGSLSVVLCLSPSVFLFLCFLVYFSRFPCVFLLVCLHTLYPFSVSLLLRFSAVSLVFLPPSLIYPLCQDANDASGLKTWDFLEMLWQLSDVERDKQRSNLA